jgi:hypothetical protein
LLTIRERLELKVEKAGCLSKSTSLAPALVVTIVVLNLGQLIRGRFVEQEFSLSSSFRCYQIHNGHRYDLNRTLLCHLSRT